MAAMRTHFTSALVTSATCVCISKWLWPLETPVLATIAAVALIGALLPDVDSDTSKPLDILFNILSLVIPVIAIYHLEFLRHTWQACSMSWLVITILVRWPMMWIFKRFTVHRGTFHSIPAALVWTCLILNVSKPYLQHYPFHKEAWLALGISAFSGYMIHLILDEIYAIDFNGFRIKKSFGSALTLFAYNFRATVMIYFVLILMGAFVI